MKNHINHHDGNNGKDHIFGIELGFHGQLLPSKKHSFLVQERKIVTTRPATAAGRRPLSNAKWRQRFNQRAEKYCAEKNCEDIARIVEKGEGNEGANNPALA
jgi:hypothetical protein